jgi:membrane protease subunit HflC
MSAMQSQENPSEIVPEQRGIVRTMLRGTGVLLLAILAVAAIATCVVFVDETEYVIIERLGRIVTVYDRPEDRGLQFKLPWPIETTRRFDRRIQLFDPPGREIFTRDKKNVTVDTYICWQIAEPAETDEMDLMARPVVRFFRGLGGIDEAELRLDSRLRSVLGTQMGQVELSELLSVQDSEQGPQADRPGRLETLSNVVLQQVDRQAGEDQGLREQLGIEIVDVRIKRLNLPVGNQQAVFERMKSERRKIADRYRSAGMADNKVIRSQADRQYAEILARAERNAAEIRGTAEAEAISVLNEAHAADPEFFRVLQTLDTYRTILNDKTTLVLSASSNLLKLLTEGIPNDAAPLPPQPSDPSKDSPGPKVSAKSPADDREDPDGGDQQ